MWNKPCHLVKENKKDIPIETATILQNLYLGLNKNDAGLPFNKEAEQNFKAMLGNALFGRPNKIKKGEEQGGKGKKKGIIKNLRGYASTKVDLTQIG